MYLKCVKVVGKVQISFSFEVQKIYQTFDRILGILMHVKMMLCTKSVS